jgi:hypothetical protein
VLLMALASVAGSNSLPAPSVCVASQQRLATPEFWATITSVPLGKEADFLLIGMLERLTALNIRSPRICNNARPPRKSRQIPPKKIHHKSLRNIIHIMPRNNILDTEPRSAPI